MVLSMTSQSSGYVTMGNRSDRLDQEHLSQDIPTPAGHFLVVSFERLVVEIGVTLYRYNGSYQAPNHVIKVWSNEGKQSDLAHMFFVNQDKFLVRGTNHAYEYPKLCAYLSHSYVSKRHSQIYSNTQPDFYRRFQFHFTFFSEHSKPQRLSQYLWNCSVHNYPRFQHHMDCNLRTECDDGRDEHQHCPFSSDRCQGMVDMCGRCYRFSNTVLTHNTSYEYCKTSRGAVGFPSCEYDPYSILVKNSQRLWDLRAYDIGLQTIYHSLPAMYKATFQHVDRTVFYHTFYVAMALITNKGLQPDFVRTINFLHMVICFQSYAVHSVCEIRTNVSTEYHPIMVSVSRDVESLMDRHCSFTEYQDADVTHKHLECGSDTHKECQKSSFNCRVSDQILCHVCNSTKLSVFLLLDFICGNTGFIAVSYSLVCDFTADCPDSSDESFCQPPVCGKSSFTCANGQCVSYSKMCDGIPQCRDHSDRATCNKEELNMLPRIPSPLLINFDGIKYFTLTPMNVNDSCPDSHYRCPGEFNNCLPIYTRCNGMYDCIGHEDEQWCEEITCAGLLQCRSSTVCVHSDHICDGYPHCPLYHDDELWCNMACPVSSCLCQAHAFLCPRPFNAQLFSDLRSLDASGSGMTPSDVSDNIYLVRLALTHCSLTALPIMTLLNLRFLDLNHNKMNHVNISSIVQLKNLQIVSLSNNPITSLYASWSLAAMTTMLKSVDLSYTKLEAFDSEIWTGFPLLRKLNLTFTCIHTISPKGFQYTPHLTHLYLDGSPFITFSADVFKDLSRLQFISTQNYKLCCKQFLPSNFDGSCVAPKDTISSCEDLLQTLTYRGFLWLMACMAISANIFCFCARMFEKRATLSGGFNIFVIHLTLADVLMGVYMIVIGVADEHYRGRYLYHDHVWKRSPTCKIAGFLSLLSSEASALLICLITLDRFIVLCFPFSTWRFGKTSAAILCVQMWLFTWFMALIPLLPVTSHWEVYGQTGVCIPLPVMRKEFKGKRFTFSIMVVLNFVLFLLISVGQLLIYWSIKRNTFKTTSTKVSKDMAIAKRLITIALTDFMCWFPIGLCGILALCGIPIPGEVNVALAIFIMPLNSAINPFLYTLNMWAEKQIMTKESELLKWMEKHSGFN